MFSDVFSALRTVASGRLGRRIRLAAAAACLVLAALSAVGSSRAKPAPRAPRGVPVVAAARTLPNGHVLRAGDLAQVQVSRDARPDGAATDLRRLVGRRLAGAVTKHEPIVTPRLLGTGLTAGLRPGFVAAPVALDSDVGGLVRAGDRVDLVSTPGADDLDDHPRRDGAAVTLVPTARVLAVLGRSQDSGSGTRLVLAVTAEQALAIAAARTSDVFTVVARAP